MLRTIYGQTEFVSRWCAPSTDKLSQLAGGSGKNTFFVGFLPIFRPVNCFWAEYLYMKRIFWKENGPSLLFLAAGTTHSKFRRSTGVTTANSTNKYQKYKSVELGDQLGWFYKHSFAVLISWCDAKKNPTNYKITEFLKKISFSRHWHVPLKM